MLPRIVSCNNCCCFWVTTEQHTNYCRTNSDPVTWGHHTKRFNIRLQFDVKSASDGADGDDHP